MYGRTNRLFILMTALTLGGTADAAESGEWEELEDFSKAVEARRIATLSESGDSEPSASKPKKHPAQVAAEVRAAETAAAEAVAASADAAKENPYFKAEQQGNNILLDTPYGRQLLYAPMGFEREADFAIEIPLDTLREKRGTTPTPAQAQKAAEDSEEFLFKANQSYVDGNYRSALNLVEDALGRNPMNARGWVMKGSLMRLLGDKEMSKRAWLKAAELDPANKEIQQLVKGIKE